MLYLRIWELLEFYKPVTAYQINFNLFIKRSAKFYFSFNENVGTSNDMNSPWHEPKREKERKDTVQNNVSQPWQAGCGILEIETDTSECCQGWEILD